MSEEANDTDFYAEGFLRTEEIIARNKLKLWINIRRVFLAVFLLGLLVMISFVGIFIYLNPKCEPYPTVEWWQNGIFYRVDLNELVRVNESLNPFQRNHFFAVV